MLLFMSPDAFAASLTLGQRPRRAPGQRFGAILVADTCGSTIVIRVGRDRVIGRSHLLIPYLGLYPASGRNERPKLRSIVLVSHLRQLLFAFATIYSLGTLAATLVAACRLKPCDWAHKFPLATGRSSGSSTMRMALRLLAARRQRWRRPATWPGADPSRQAHYRSLLAAVTELAATQFGRVGPVHGTRSAGNPRTWGRRGAEQQPCQGNIPALRGR